MDKSTRICKICGAEYKYCKTELKGKRFRWQDVACCEEHGVEYFRLIAESRDKSKKTEPVKKDEQTEVIVDKDLVTEEDKPVYKKKASKKVHQKSKADEL